MKAKVTFILSLISFVGVLSVWGLWLFRNFKLSVVSLDTFIGVIVALLAIIFTVVVGWQIINAIEMRDKLAALEKRQNDLIENERILVENDRLHTKEAYNLQSGLCGEIAESHRTKGQYIEAFTFYHAALYFAILSERPNQMNHLNQMNLILSLISTRSVTNFTSLAQQIKDDTERIRKTTSYRNCLSEIYEQTMQLFWEKMKNLGIAPEKN